MKFYHFTEESEVRELIKFHNAKSISCVADTETTGLDVRVAKVLDVQLEGYEPDSAVMFGAEFLPLLLDFKIPLVWWNYKYDVSVCHFNGVDLRKLQHIDAMLLDHLVDENREHSLDSHVQEKYQDDFKERFWAKFKNYQDAPFEERLAYSCADVVYTRRIYNLLRDQLQGKEGLVEHVHRLAAALLDTEIRGIRVDLNYTVGMGTELKSDIIKTEGNLRRLGGAHCELVELALWLDKMESRKTPKGKAGVPKPEFNFSSGPQMKDLLYGRLKLPVQIDRKTKKPTLNDKALEKLGDAHPILPELRKLRKMSKMYGSFVEGVMDRAEEGRVYPTFNVNGTVTGRLSHANPNMAQMPSRGDWVKIRGIFTPDPGHKLITADYGQLEVCIAAHYSQDENLLKIILEGASQHDITAAGLGIERSLAKQVNFSMQYGATEFKIKEILNCSEKDAKEALAKYWETYKGLKTFIDWCHAELAAGRPIANPFGRLRRFPTKFKDKWELASAQRQVFSSLIQGTGGDMMSMAFYRTYEELKRRGWGDAWFTVHDEGLIQAKEANLAEAEALLVDNMLKVGTEIALKVPLKVESSGPLDRWQK